MKKLLILSLALLINEMQLKSQELLEIYKKGKVYLEEVADYGNKNNWETLLDDYNNIQYGTSTGKQKRIVVSADGSVFMSHRSKYEIWKFDKNGNFLKKFGKQGNGVGQFPFKPEVYGILDNKYVFTSDNQGRVMFFDLEGNYVKNLQLDYMPLQMVPLKNSKIAIVGYTNSKTIVSIKDFNSGKDKFILYENDINDDGNITIKLPNGGIMSFMLPYSLNSNSWFKIAVCKNGNLIVASPDKGKIFEYSTDGVKLGEADLNITPLLITEADVKSNYETAIKNKDAFEEKLKKNKKYSEKDVQNVMTQYNNQISKFKDKKFYPEHMPYFSSLLVDSEGNIIVFEYTKAEISNSFRAYTYDNNGKYICTSSFYTYNYELNFEPYSFVINNGYVYALATKNNCSDKCLRLVKFKMVQKN
jgi:hypothetical protein